MRIADLDGLLSVSLIDSFNPEIGEFFDVLTALNINLKGLVLSGQPGFDLQTVSGGNGPISRLNSTAIPEPASFTVFVLLAGVVILRRGPRRLV